MLPKTMLRILLSFTMLSSCAFFDSGGETIKGKYNVVWIDIPSNRSICYASNEGGSGGSQKVGAFIKRLGANDRFIIAERIYFDVFEQMDKPDYDSVAFYIIDMDKESSYGDGDVFGPFSEDEFEREKRSFGIAALQFTEEYYE